MTATLNVRTASEADRQALVALVVGQTAGYTLPAPVREAVLAIETAEPPRAMEFLPLRPLEIRHAAPQPFRRRPAGAALTLDAVERLREPPARLTGVLVVDREQAVTVDVARRRAQHEAQIAHAAG